MPWQNLAVTCALVASFWACLDTDGRKHLGVVSAAPDDKRFNVSLSVLRQSHRGDYSPQAALHRPCHTVSVGIPDRVARE
jgi:hypothetical protein